MMNIRKMAYSIILGLSLLAAPFLKGIERPTCGGYGYNSYGYYLPKSSTDCHKWFASADLLCWYALEDGLYQIKSVSNDDIVVFPSPAGVGNAVQVNRARRTTYFQWWPGIRLVGGYNLSGLELRTAFTYYHTQIDNSFGELNKFTSKLDTYILDAVAGKKVKLSKYISVRPYGGLRTALFYQKVSQQAIIQRPLPNTQIGLKIHEKYKGIGPIVGAEASLNVTNSIEIHGDLSAGMLFSRFRDKFTQNQFNRLFTVSKQTRVVDQLVADAAIGIRWRSYIAKNMPLLLGLTFEHHRYYDHNQIDIPGDLTFNGFSFSTKIEF